MRLIKVMRVLISVVRPCMSNDFVAEANKRSSRYMVMDMGDILDSVDSIRKNLFKYHGYIISWLYYLSSFALSYCIVVLPLDYMNFDVKDI